MKQIIFLIVITFICLFGFESCNKANSENPQNNIIQIRTCSSISQAEFPVICFDSIVAESRCPIGVSCPTAGYAAVKLTFKNGTGPTQSFLLSTLAGTHSTMPPNDTLLNGYNIKLVNVFPYPNILALPHPDGYKVELQISK